FWIRWVCGNLHLVMRARAVGLTNLHGRTHDNRQLRFPGSRNGSSVHGGHEKSRKTQVIHDLQNERVAPATTGMNENGALGPAHGNQTSTWQARTWVVAYAAPPYANSMHQEAPANI